METNCIKCETPLPASGYCFVCKIYYIDPDQIQDLDEIISKIDYEVYDDENE